MSRTVLVLSVHYQSNLQVSYIELWCVHCLPQLHVSDYRVFCMLFLVKFLLFIGVTFDRRAAAVGTASAPFDHNRQLPVHVGKCAGSHEIWRWHVATSEPSTRVVHCGRWFCTRCVWWHAMVISQQVSPGVFMNTLIPPCSWIRGGAISGSRYMCWYWSVPFASGVCT